MTFSCLYRAFCRVLQLIRLVGGRDPDLAPKPWVDADVTADELRIEPDCLGSVMTVLAYANRPGLPDEARRRVHYRLGTIFGAALRTWVDEPQWQPYGDGYPNCPGR